MPAHSGLFPVYFIPVNSVITALSYQFAIIVFQMFNEVSSFHQARIYSLPIMVFP